MRTIPFSPPPMYPLQQYAFYHPARYSHIEASTKSGKTYGGLAWLMQQAFTYGQPGDHFWWVAPISAQAAIAYQRAKLGLAPLLGECPFLYKPHDTNMQLRLMNGAMMWFRNAEHPDNLYGYDVKAVVLDESSRMREESWHAVRSTLTKTEGRARIIGNVRGRKNWAFREARMAQRGDPDMVYTKMTAFDAVRYGVLSQKEIDDAKERLPPHVFQELYLAEASEDGSNPFGADAIRACTGVLSSDEPFVYGIDLGSRIDWTVIVGMDRQKRVSYFDRFQLPWPATIERIRETVGETNTLIDETGVGAPIVEELQSDYDTGHAYEGFVFTSTSKQQIFERLAVDIQSERIEYPPGPIVEELGVFEYEVTRTGYRYAAMEGFHDDVTCALALANQIASEPEVRWQ